MCVCVCVFLCMYICTNSWCFSVNARLSIIGGIIIAVGLYCVVWGKGKDDLNLAPSLLASPTTREIETQQLPITSIDISKMDTAVKTIYPQSTK